jgi:putative oxidoreductase
VQRLFSMFPAGLPGVALLLLRASVAIALLLEDYAHRQDLAVWIQVTAIFLSVATSVGYLTPIAAVMGLVLHGLIWSRLGTGSMVVIIVSLDAMALALLGPGAYSFDSYRFGRRVVLPPP